MDLNKRGNIKSINISINYFDNNYNYVGRGNYSYKNKNLNYIYESKENCKSVSDCKVNNMIKEDYSKSLNIKYLSNNLKRIPFSK